MDVNDLIHRFRYHKPNDSAIVAHGNVRNKALDFATELNSWLPEGREKALAITHLEEVVMWANAAIARNGVPDASDS